MRRSMRRNRREERKTKGGRKPARPKGGPTGPEERRVVEFLTVGWMLAVLTTLLCEVGAAAATWYANWRPQEVQIAALASMLLFAALVIGLLALGLMAAVWKMRRVKPPPGIMVFSAVIGGLPLVVLFVQWLRQ